MQGCNSPRGLVTSRPHSTLNLKRNSPHGEESTAPCERNAPQPTQIVTESSILSKAGTALILSKAGTALEVLRDVLNTIDTQHPEVFSIIMKNENCLIITFELFFFFT